jgi:hypothetical protein
VVDFFSETWIRRKRKDEIPPVEETAPVRYGSSASLLSLAGGLLTLALISKVSRTKRRRRSISIS